MYSNYNFAYASETKPQTKQGDLVEINSDNFGKLLNEYPIIVVDVWAPWCNPCKAAGEKFMEFTTIFESFIEDKQVIFVKDNIENEDSVHATSIEAVPTFFVYFHGQLYKRLTGFSMQDIGDAVQELLSGNVTLTNQPKEEVQKNIGI